MNQLELQNYILDSIDLLIEERFKMLVKQNYYIEASIVSVNDDSTCDIEYNDQLIQSIKIREGLILTVSDIVLVCVVNGNFSNKFIDLKRP